MRTISDRIKVTKERMFRFPMGKLCGSEKGSWRVERGGGRLGELGRGCWGWVNRLGDSGGGMGGLG